MASRLNRLKDSAIPVDIVQVPMALGSDQPGVDKGAAALDHALRARLERRGFDEISNRLSISHEIPVQPLDEAQALEPPGRPAMYCEGVADAVRRLSNHVAESVRSGQLALVLGGDHALSIGSIAGASSLGRLGVIWIDAHGDINTPETSPSRHINGMPLAASLGYGPPELVSIGNRFDLALDDLVYIGVRDLDPGERQLLRQAPAMAHTMTSIELLGILGVVAETVRRLEERGVDSVHISFDVDALDPLVLPGNNGHSPGGLTYREAHLLMASLHSSDLPVVSADVVELNPDLDPGGNSTRIAAALTSTLLGEVIV